jgi:hypothetical protein
LLNARFGLVIKLFINDAIQVSIAVLGGESSAA